jgi:non-heme chloroperoxidase
MPSISIKSHNEHFELYYEQYGDGDPVVLLQAYTMSCHAWKKQVRPLVSAGYQVVMYDRRGFGKSGRPSQGYDINTLVSDLNCLLETLDLKRVTLVGHSMGGAEVARYLSRHGEERVRKAIYISAVNPYLAKAPDNPLGIDPEIFRSFQASLLSDRPAALASNLSNFYNTGAPPSTTLVG